MPGIVSRVGFNLKLKIKIMNDQMYVLWQYPVEHGFQPGQLVNTAGLKPFLIRLFEDFKEAVDYKQENNLGDHFQIKPYYK